MVYFLFTILALLNVFLFLVVRRKGYFFISLPALLYFISSSYTFFGVLLFDFSSTIPFDLFSYSREVDINSSVLYFQLCAISYMVGLIFIKKANATQSLNYIIPMSQSTLLIMVMLWFIIYIPSYGLDNIIERQIYIPDFNFRLGVILATLVLPVSSFCLGYITNKFLKRIIFIIYLLVLLMTSSRAIVIFIALYFVGGVLRTGKISALKCIIMFMLSIWLTAFALFARYQPVQGFQNIIYFFTWFDLDNIQLSINYLFSFSVGVLSYAQTEGGTVSLAQLISYINPLPSGMINFKEHENLIGAAPYSAVSLLYLFAPISGIIYFSLSGFLWGKIYSNSLKSFIFSKLFICLSLIFAYMSLQYTLRASTRILYYAIFIYFLYILMKRLALAFRK